MKNISKLLFLNNIFICSALAFIMSAAPSYAQKAKELTEQNITRFIEKTSDIASGKSLENPEKIKSFLEKHLHEDARFKSVMKYNIPGFPTQENALSLNKEEFINTIGKGSGAVSDYDNEIEIKSIKISSDKTKATVQTEGFEEGMMEISPDGETIESVPIEGVSTCQQIIMLSKKKYIQMYQANCTTEIMFQQDF